MKLGILIKNNEIVNHRSLLKVLLNPVFRYFGYCIGSKFNDLTFQSYVIFKTEKSRNIKWDLNSYNDYDYIIKKNMYI